MSESGDGPDIGEEVERKFLRDVRRELREEESAESGKTVEPESAEMMVELKEIRLAFDSRPVLDGVSLALYRGETLCILGGSGVGKSTILRLVLRLTRPDAGEIRVRGRDITSLPLEEVMEIRRSIGMVFQGAALFDSLSVFDNVAFPLYEHTSLPEERVRERVREVLSFVDLDVSEVEDLLPAELSGGMKKRVGIARAIAHEPEILLFDEPTSGLDPITTRTINELVDKLRRELDVASVVVTHEIRSAFSISNRVALLHRGRIVFMGTPDAMTESEDEYVRDFLR